MQVTWHQRQFDKPIATVDDGRTIWMCRTINEKTLTPSIGFKVRYPNQGKIIYLKSKYVLTPADYQPGAAQSVVEKMRSEIEKELQSISTD